MPNTYAATNPKKFLDADGLAHFARKLNNYPTNDVISAVIDGVQDALDEKADLSLKGQANGLAELDSSGKVPTTQLPAFVSDILEFNGRSNFPVTGNSGKIYVDISVDGGNKTYRWSGSTYIEISPSLTLGTTESTAFRGDHGNTAYQHAIGKGSQFSLGLHKFATNEYGHVTEISNVFKSDITALGIPSQDTTYAFDGTYNASSNKAATVQTVANAVNAITPASIGAAIASHTHTTLIASSNATNQLTLAANTKYSITAGNTTFVFTTPPDTTYDSISNSEIDAMFV